MFALIVVNRRGSELLGVYSKKSHAVAAAGDYTSGDQYWGDYIYVTKTTVKDHHPCWSMSA